MCNLVVTNLAGAAVVNFHQFRREVKVEVGDVTVQVAGRVTEGTGDGPDVLWCRSIVFVGERIT